MVRLKITQSLLSSWNYVYACHEGQEENAMEEFSRTLRKEPVAQSEAMQSGIEFEGEVYKAIAGAQRAPHQKWESGIEAVAQALQGAVAQVKLARDIEVAGQPYLLSGVIDALRAGVIYDVKFAVKSLASSGSSYYPGKYLDSAQQSAYFRLVADASSGKGP